MVRKFSLSLPIRSFDLNGEAYRILAERFNIVFINTTGKRLEGRDLIRALTNADAAIAGTEHYTADVLEACPRLRLISRVGTGTDNIDSARAAKLGVAIRNTPDAPVPAVAEHTIALILSATKNIPQYDRLVRGRNHSVLPGSMLVGKTLGIIGMGRIGKRVAALSSCFGCKVIWHDPWSTADLPPEWVKSDNLQDLLAISDIITIHAAPAQNQKPILNRDTLSLCRKGVIIINTARASFIDETALTEALATGRISAVCLDVQSEEPYDGPLLSFENVIITPHIASNTLETRRQMELEAVHNLVETLETKEP
ncbi:MAG: Glyoxylate reductase [Methanoregula sp. PtaU1.Bin051]|nr:MAG: Glyoxylate reductase [Methanoregula sp. PtaU1.Bin051]